MTRLSHIMIASVTTLMTVSGFAATQIIGHRGSSYEYPENTLPSMEQAWKEGAEGAEIDVYLTTDNRIVAMHDKTTSRTTDKDYVVTSTSSAVLRGLDAGSWKDPRFAGTKIPFLEEVIAKIPAGKKLVVEIKCGTEILPHLKEMISSSGKASQIMLICFNREVCEAAKKMMPEREVLWLSSTKKKQGTKRLLPHDLKLIDLAKKGGLDGVDVEWSGTTPEFAKACKAAGMQLLTWTVDDPVEAKRLRDLGVDGITTNRPGYLLKVLREDR